jgi:hypothetical protein
MVEDMFEVSMRWPGGIVEPLAVRIRSSTEVGRQLQSTVARDFELRNPNRTRFNASIASTD